MNGYKEGSREFAIEQAKKMSIADRGNYYHIIKKGENYTVSRYWDRNSVECYSKGVLYRG